MRGLSAVAARRTVRLALAVPPQRDALVLAGAAHCVDHPLLALEHLGRTSFPRLLFRGARCAPSPALEHTYPTAFGEASRPQLAPLPLLPLLLLPPSGESRRVSASLGESRRVSAKPTSWQRAPPSASVSSETRSASSVSTMCLACGRECLGGAPIPGSLPYALGAGSPTPREGEPTGDARPLSNVMTCSQQCQGMGRLGSVGSGVCSHTPRVGGPGP